MPATKKSKTSHREQPISTIYFNERPGELPYTTTQGFYFCEVSLPGVEYVELGEADRH